MELQDLINKWEEQKELHRRVSQDALMYTKEDKLRNSHYTQVLCAVLSDLNELKDSNA